MQWPKYAMLLSTVSRKYCVQELPESQSPVLRRLKSCTVQCSGCLGLNTGQAHSRNVPKLLYYLQTSSFQPFKIFLMGAKEIVQ